MFAVLLQAEVIGESIGRGIFEAIVTVLIGIGVISGFAFFLWLVRKIDKKINK